MKRVNLSDGYLEVCINKSPEVSLKFVRNDIISFKMFRKVDRLLLQSLYRINMTKYIRWYEENKNNFAFGDVEKESYKFAHALYGMAEDLFFPNISCLRVNSWFAIFADNKKFISHGKERLVK